MDKLTFLRQENVELKRTEFLPCQPVAHVMEHPIRLDGRRGERAVAHRITAADDRRAIVIVRTIAAWRGIILGIAASKTAAEQHELAVGHDVMPRNALPIVRFRPPAVAGVMVRLPAVERADESVMAAFAEHRSLVLPEDFTACVEGGGPFLRRPLAVVESSGAVVVVHRGDCGEDIDEKTVRADVVADELHVLDEPWPEGVRQPAVALGVAPLVVPCALRRAVRIEDDVVVAEALRIRIEIDVIVMRSEDDAVFLAGVRQLLERFKAAQRRIDFWQAVVVAPPLPHMLHEDAVLQAVLGGHPNVLRGGLVVPSPLVKALPPKQFVQTGRRLEADDPPVFLRRHEGVLRRRG